MCAQYRSHFSFLRSRSSTLLLNFLRVVALSFSLSSARSRSSRVAPRATPRSSAFLSSSNASPLSPPLTFPTTENRIFSVSLFFSSHSRPAQKPALLRLSVFVPSLASLDFDGRFVNFGKKNSSTLDQHRSLSYNDNSLFFSSPQKNIPSLSIFQCELSITKAKKDEFFFSFCDETKMSVVGNDPTFDFSSKSGETKSGERQGEREIPIKPRI